MGISDEVIWFHLLKHPIESWNSGMQVINFHISAMNLCLFCAGQSASQCSVSYISWS